jgi:hypothetical protein
MKYGIVTPVSLPPGYCRPERETIVPKRGQVNSAVERLVMLVNGSLLRGR